MSKRQYPQGKPWELEGEWRDRARESGKHASPPVVVPAASSGEQHELVAPFDSILSAVGAENYGHASARAYVQLHHRNRPRYAKM